MRVMYIFERSGDGAGNKDDTFAISSGTQATICPICEEDCVILTLLLLHLNITHSQCSWLVRDEYDGFAFGGTAYRFYIHVYINQSYFHQLPHPFAYQHISSKSTTSQQPVTTSQQPVTTNSTPDNQGVPDNSTPVKQPVTPVKQPVTPVKQPETINFPQTEQLIPSNSTSSATVSHQTLRTGKRPERFTRCKRFLSLPRPKKSLTLSSFLENPDRYKKPVNNVADDREYLDFFNLKSVQTMVESIENDKEWDKSVTSWSREFFKDMFDDFLDLNEGEKLISTLYDTSFMTAREVSSEKSPSHILKMIVDRYWKQIETTGFSRTFFILLHVWHSTGWITHDDLMKLYYDIGNLSRRWRQDPSTAHVTLLKEPESNDDDDDDGKKKNNKRKQNGNNNDKNLKKLKQVKDWQRKLIANNHRKTRSFAKSNPPDH